MKRYYIDYSLPVTEVLALLDMTGRQVYAMHDNVLANGGSKVLPQSAVLVDEPIGIVDICLTSAEVTLLEQHGCKVSLRPADVSGTALFDADGTDTNGWEFCNPFAKVSNYLNYYPTTPYRVEYYGNATFSPTNNDSCATVTGNVIMPQLYYFGINRLWAKGLNGAGVKVGVLDEGVKIDANHESFSLAGSYNSDNPGNAETITSIHGTGRCGDIGGNRGIYGGAPGCTMYAANFSNVPASLSYLISAGCRIINCSFTYTNTDAYVNKAIASFVADGGIVVVAAGNSTGAPASVNLLASVPGTTAVTGMIGGNIYKFTDTCYFSSVLPVNGKGVDFMVSAVSNCATFDFLNLTGPKNFYAGSRGTSTAAAQMSGYLALLMQFRPDMAGRHLVAWAKMNSRRSSDGFLIPDFSLIN